MNNGLREAITKYIARQRHIATFAMHSDDRENADAVANDLQRMLNKTAPPSSPDLACKDRGDHHSDDTVLVHRGGPTPEVMCGYHASRLSAREV